MYLNKYILSILVIIVGILNACTKDKRPPATNAPADIYLSGITYAGPAYVGPTVATYWKNGAAVKLADTTIYSIANAITLDGNDVYVTGSISNRGVYWKNGIATALQGDRASRGNAIAVNGNNAYVAGVMGTNNGGIVAEYWKNGTPIRLVNDSSTFSGAFGVALSGNDVYIAGYLTANTGHEVATCWKNGVATILTDLSSDSWASSISIAGGNVYIAGTTGVPGVATVWKNGVATTVGASGSFPFSITVSGNSIYLAGNSNNTATYWENGLATRLPFSASISSIGVNGTDIYVGGHDNIGPIYPKVTYWKNSIPVHLAQNGYATGIVIAPK